MTGARCLIWISFASCPIIGLGASSDGKFGCGMCRMKIDTQLEFVPDHSVATVEVAKYKKI